MANANDPALQERFPCGFLGGHSVPARRRQRARPQLSTLTAAGQRYTMAKIVGVLSVPSVGPWMDDLTQQSARLAPDVGVFSRRAMDIVALLRASIDPLRG
jgi:hypothetical protein